MRSSRLLLDVNVLIALLDPKHDLHSVAHGWWSSVKDPAWASYALTENGVVRIMSNPNYHSRASFPISKVCRQLTMFSNSTDHQHWPDNISILSSSIFDYEYILGPRQITEAYLLALAVRNGGNLVTFDTGISITSVSVAKPENLVVVC